MPERKRFFPFDVFPNRKISVFFTTRLSVLDIYFWYCSGTWRFEEDRDDVNPLIVTWLNSRLTFSYFNFLNGTKSWSYCGKSIVPWFSFDLSLIVCLLLLHRNNAPLFVATFKMYLRHHHCHHHRHQIIYIKLTLNFLFTTILFHWLINYNFILIFYFFGPMSYHSIVLPCACVLGVRLECGSARWKMYKLITMMLVKVLIFESSRWIKCE